MNPAAEIAYPAIAPRIQAVARHARMIWRRQRPVVASLWGEPLLDCSENLTSVALQGWRDDLGALARSVDRVRTEGASPLDDVLCDELARFCREQIFEAEVLRPYETSLAPYLHLIALGLVPFETGDHRSDDHAPLLEGRLAAALGWLRCARERQLAIASPAVEHFASELARAVDVLGDSWTQFAGIRQAASRLASEIGRFPRGGMAVDDGCSQRADPLRVCAASVIEERMWQALGQLDSRGLKLPAPEWDGDVWTRMAGGAPGEPTGDAAVDWLVIASAALRRYDGFPSVSGGASIVRASPLLNLLVPDALFLRSAARGGRLVLSTRLYSDGRPLSRRDRLYLALIAAHELTPGHQEHAWRGASSPVAPLSDMAPDSAGLEGWAVYAERAVGEIDRSAVAVCAYQMLRRLIPATLRLTYLDSGAKAVAALREKIVARHPHVPRELLLQPRSNKHLPYAFGFVETERQLLRVQDACGDRRLARNAYAAQGPIGAASAARLAIDSLRGEKPADRICESPMTTAIKTDESAEHPWRSIHD